MPVISVKKILSTILLCGLFLSLNFCTFLSTKNFGKFLPDNHVTSAFDNAEISPEFNYYITGSDTYPRSILGLKKSITLDSDLWKKIELKQEEFKELTSRMLQRAIQCCGSRPYGFAVLDDKGKQIGIWYSIFVTSISIKVLDDGKVIIYPPNDKDYSGYDDQGNTSSWGK